MCHFIFVLCPEVSLISPQEHADTSAIAREQESTLGARVDQFSSHSVSRKKIQEPGANQTELYWRHVQASLQTHFFCSFFKVISNLISLTLT